LLLDAREGALERLQLTIEFPDTEISVPAAMPSIVNKDKNVDESESVVALR
jgi:hypothetical protein